MVNGMEFLRDNPSAMTALLIGVGVVLIGSAATWLARVVLVAGIVLIGVAVAESDRPAEQVVTETYGRVVDEGVSRLPDDVGSQLDQFIGRAEEEMSDVFTSDNLANFLERANGGLERLDDLLNLSPSDKGVLPESIRSLDDFAHSD